MKNLGGKLEFYCLVGILNIAVGMMFYAVNTPAPVMAVSAAPIIKAQPKQPQSVPATVGVPTRLVIADVAIDLAVDVGSYSEADGSWTIDATKAYYADISLPVNDSNGTTLIYGHAQSPVFGRLPEVTPRSKAIVHTDTGYVFHYKFASMKQVLPTDTTVFSADGPPTLVLQTCIGDWDAYRALFSFSFESVEKL